MTTAFCPECEEKVTLPSASQTAKVQCPLCEAEFGLAKLLESVPPTLIVVDDPEAQAAEDVTSDEQASESSDDGFSLEALSDQAEDFSLDGEEPSVRTTFVRSSDRQAFKGGGLRSVIQVVFGGLLALPLAQLALWYWPWGPQDPLDLGPKLSSYAAVKWVVPARYHDSLEENSVEVPAKKSDFEPSNNPEFDPEGKFDNFDSNTRNRSALDDENARQMAGPNSTPANPTLDELSNGKPDELVNKPIPLSPTDYVRGAATYRAMVLEVVLKRAQKQSKEWSGRPTDIGDKQRHLENGDLASSLRQLAESFTFYDSSDETTTGVMGEIVDFFQESATNQAMLDVIDFEFIKTVENSTENIQGAVFTATVAATTNVNGYRQAEMTLSESNTKMALVFSPQIASDFEPDQTYLIVGSLVLQPRRVLQNYLGVSESVVVLGTYLPLSVNVADAGQ